MPKYDQPNLSTRKRHRADSTGRAHKTDAGGDRVNRRSSRSSTRTTLQQDSPQSVIADQVAQCANARTPHLSGEVRAMIKNVADTLCHSGKVTKTDFYQSMGLDRNWEYKWLDRSVAAGTIENRQGQGGGKQRFHDADGLVRLWDTAQNEH